MKSTAVSVLAVTLESRIVASAAVSAKPVVAIAAVQRVIVRSAVDRVVAAAGINPVVAIGIAIECVASEAAVAVILDALAAGNTDVQPVVAWLETPVGIPPCQSSLKEETEMS